MLSIANRAASRDRPEQPEREKITVGSGYPWERQGLLRVLGFSYMPLNTGSASTCFPTDAALQELCTLHSAYVCTLHKHLLLTAPSSEMRYRICWIDTSL